MTSGNEVFASVAVGYAVKVKSLSLKVRSVKED
jgi:hypothetical protein